VGAVNRQLLCAMGLDRGAAPGPCEAAGELHALGPAT
jgi:hypothetical protein